MKTRLFNYLQIFNFSFPHNFLISFPFFFFKLRKQKFSNIITPMNKDLMGQLWIDWNLFEIKKVSGMKSSQIRI